MVINTGKESEEAIVERVKERIVQERGICKYLGMVINKSGNLKDNILMLNSKCEVINRVISAIRAKRQVGNEEMRVELKLYETGLMSPLLYGLEGWRKTGKDEVNEIEKIQERALKRYSTFQYQHRTSYVVLIVATFTWPASRRMQYSTMMLYYIASSIVTKTQTQERHDLKRTTDSTRNRSKNKKFGMHEEIQMGRAGERKK